MNARLQDIVAARRAVERAVTKRELNAAWESLQELRRREREAFASSRGWVAVPRFTTGQLLGLRGRNARDVEGTEEVIDHRSCFALAESSSRKPRPIAICSHIYGSPKPCLQFADRYALAVEMLDASWWWPGHATAVLLTRPD
ncbi:MAG: hypothetical protein ABI821_05300 [Pseudomonadota bacterium]